MAAYYNEFDPFAAAWLRNLIAAGHIAPGDVDERSIVEVKADDLKGYTQCHFFAGIGGWSYALRLAGWDDSRPVWTGSAPCQPFSSAGNQKGKDDSRHLFPVWLGLIRECHPPIIFGEQVASAIAHGWLDDVYQGLEAEGYACGSAILPAVSVGAPHKRDRLWFVANSSYDRRDKERKRIATSGSDGLSRDNSGTLANTESSEPSSPMQTRSGGAWTSGSGSGFMADASCRRFGEPCQGEIQLTGRTEAFGASSSMANSECLRQQRSGPLGKPMHSAASGVGEASGSDNVGSGFCGSTEWLECADGKARPVEPSIPLLAHGIPNRVGKLRGYGNAIVPQVAAEFITAFMEC